MIAKQPKLNKKRILALYDSFDYVSKQQNVIWIGPTGAGKSGLASSFLTQAINKRHTGRFITFPELVEELYRSVGDHSERKVIKTFSSYDCLLIDRLCKASHNSSITTTVPERSGKEIVFDDDAVETNVLLEI